MRSILRVCFLATLAACGGAPDHQSESQPTSAPTSQPAAPLAELTVEPAMHTADVALSDGYQIRGDGVTAGAIFTAPMVLANAEQFNGRTVRIEGEIVQMCKGQGCWMNLGEQGKTVYVDYVEHEQRYFPPLGSDGRRVIAQGKVNVATKPNGSLDVSMKCSGLALKN